MCSTGSDSSPKVMILLLTIKAYLLSLIQMIENKPQAIRYLSDIIGLQFTIGKALISEKLIFFK
jgi:hypothetical protein